MFRVLHYIDMVHKERSFSKAAQKLHLAQSSLSLTIKKFEQDIGIQIFDRSTTPIQLTEPGLVYLKGIQEILSIEKDLEAYADDYKELRKGQLVLGAAHLFASYLLPSLMTRFLRKYPHIEIRIVEGDFPRLHEMVLEGEIDLLFEPHTFNPGLFNSEPLFEERILLAVPNQDPINKKLAKYRLGPEDIRRDVHLLSDYPPVDLASFQDHRFLMMERGYDMRGRAKQLCRDSGFEPATSMELNQLMTAYSMVDQQLGIAFVSDTIVKLSHTGINISFYKLTGPNATRYINMAWKRNRYVSRAMNAFRDLMKEITPGGISSVSAY